MNTSIEEGERAVRFTRRTNLILLVDADGDSIGLVMEAAARTGHGVRLAKTSRNAFELLKNGIHDIDVVIVDVDPGAHGLALLEAISGCEEKPLMLVLSGLKEAYMKRIAARHGAAACLGKPIAIETLHCALDRLSARIVASGRRCCDRWGHLCEHAFACTN